MKTELTKEQSQHLIDLGVPKEKASKVAWARITDFKGDKIPENEQMRGVGDKPFSMMHVGFESFKTDDIFTLEDFLNGDILPKEIVYYEDYNSEFTLQWNCSIQKWDVGYMYNTGFWKKTRYSFEELIDGLYKLACWYYGEYLKNKEK